MHWFGVGFMFGMGLLIPVVLMLAAFFIGLIIVDIAAEYIKENSIDLRKERKPKKTKAEKAKPIKMGFM